MTSAPSAYSPIVQLSESATRNPPARQVAVFAWPMPRLWPNSCDSTSPNWYPLIQMFPPRIVPRPAQPPQSGRFGKYTATWSLPDGAGRPLAASALLRIRAWSQVTGSAIWTQLRALAWMAR